MPRVANCGDDVEDWCDEHGLDHGTTYDLCARCHVRLAEAPRAFDDRLPPTGAGEPRGRDGWTADIDHPPYAYFEAHCALCGVRLTTLDDRRSIDCCSTPDAACASHSAALRVRRLSKA